MINQTKTTLLILVFSFLFSGFVVAQDAKDAKEEQPYLTVYFLRHTPIDIVVDVAQTLFEGSGVRLVADKKLNSLVFLGNKSEHKLMEETTEKLDAAPREHAVQVFKLNHLGADAAESVLTKMMSGSERWKRIRIASDLRANTLIVSGSVQEISELEKLVTLSLIHI